MRRRDARLGAVVRTKRGWKNSGGFDAPVLLRAPARVTRRVLRVSSLGSASLSITSRALRLFLPRFESAACSNFASSFTGSAFSSAGSPATRGPAPVRPTFAGGFFRDERVRAPTQWSATGAVGGPASGIFLGSAPRPPFVTSFSTFFLSPGAALLLADERLRVEGAMVVSAEDAPTLPARIARCPRTRRPRCRALSVPSFRVAERRAPSRRGLPRVDARAVCFEKTGDASTLNSRGARKPSARARSKRRRRAGRLGTSDRALFTVRDPSFFPDPRSTGASERLTPTKSRFTAPGRDRPLL